MNQDSVASNANSPRSDLQKPSDRDLSVIRYPILALNQFFADHGTIRAAALTYTTLLAIVPMMAFAFASLRGLGFADDIFEFILRQLGPVFNPEMRERLSSYVMRVNVKTLGVTGLAAFLFSAVLTLNTIEKSLNAIFEVRQQRRLIRKFTDYFSILFLTPMLLGITFSATAVFQARNFLAPLGDYWILTSGAAVFLKMIPMLSSVVLFTLVLMVIPNTHVRLIPATLGGVVGGFFWYFLQWGYVSFQIGFSRYEAIFGTLAQLPILMVWIYFAWCILIYAAELTAIAGGKRVRRQGSDNRTDQGSLTDIALLVMTSLASRAATREPPWTIANLSETLDSPPEIMKTAFKCLQEKGLLTETGEGGGLLLTRDPATISALEIVDAVEVRTSRHENGDNRRVNPLLQEINSQRLTALDGVTLLHLREAEAGSSPGHEELSTE